ncbi:MAG: hypothetical protein HFH82_11820 [Lachnospiraceae bacterium]|nr:hypothetical protein [Lachnospiraceae bacterium]
MDFNQNQRNQQNNDGSWDRWNSNASNSSYYNQPTHRPYGQAFTIASGICGLMSVTACCTGILSLPLGALGILFAALTYRKGKKMNSASLVGVVSSCVGIISAVIITINTFTMLPALMENESFRYQLDTMTQQMYGMDFQTFMEEFYGYSFE